MPEIGRPTTYTPELAERICELVATTRMSMLGITNRLKSEGIEICKDTVFSWLHKHPDFADQYARAKILQRLPIEDGIREESANEENDWEFRPNYNGPASWQINGTAINRSRLIVETEWKLMQKLWPKVYGETQQMALTADIKIDRNITVTYVNPPALQGPRLAPETYQPAVEIEVVPDQDEEFIDEWDDED